MDAPVECARHPGRPALTSCARCGRPVCREDLIEAPVGYQCVDCARSAPPVRRLGDPLPTPHVTRALVLMIVGVAMLGTTGAVSAPAFGLVPLLVGLGEWWRPITSAFLHAGFLHLAFNGVLLWRLGHLLEPLLGPGAFLGLAASGMAGGSLGVVGLSWLVVATPVASLPAAGWVLGAGPTTITVGASGAVFGLMGAVLVLLRRRGIDPWATQEGSMVAGLVILNLILTFAVPSISVGGHLGGLAAGSAAALLVGRPKATRGAGGGRLTDRTRDAVATLLLATLLLAVSVVIARDLVRVLSA
jgi:membrane associated rhomboid family serine protease